MTPQEIFNTVATHLFTQGEQAKAFDENGYCVYRANNGFKCAVGCLITDEFYQPDMEHSRLLEVIRKYNLPDYFSSNSSLLEALRITHDDSDYWASDSVMENRLAEVANRFGLDSSILDSLSFPRKP